MRILVLGISVRAMIESAVHSNYDVLALDAFGDRDLSALAESHSLHRDFNVHYSPQALFDAGRRLDFDAFAYTSGMENHPEFLRKLAENHRIIGNSPQVAEKVRCWRTLLPKLEKAGFPVPKTVFPGETTVMHDAGRRLVKPILSGGGHGIELYQGEKPPGDGFMLQEYIPGKSCSASFAANGRECVLLGIAEQLVGLREFGAWGFRYCGNILPLREALPHGNEIVKQVQRLAAFLTREYGLTGVNGLDFILDGDRVRMTEINPRYSASMELIERAYGLPVFHIHTQAVLKGDLPEFGLESVIDSQRFFGKAVIFAGRDAIAPDTRDWMARDIRDVPAPGERLPKGSPVCTVFAGQPTFDETFDRLIGRVGEIGKEIYE